MFRKILIANRGEISVRICRAAKKLGIPTLAIYAEDDQHSLHLKLADQAVSLGEGKLSNTYLNIDKILDIALQYGCDAIHPGYGFLSENPAFVKACEDQGLVFIGPSSEAISLMGNKIAARKFAEEAGVPITRGFSGSKDDITRHAIDLSFPLLIKAAAGGGGKGMRIVENANALQQAIASTSREAASYFGNDTVYVEEYLESPRHIEVQVLGDNRGNVVHLFERECSLQRRYQKIIEEAPSPTLSDEVRKEICDAAVKLAKAIPYTNAGTIEFLLDKDQKFYFLEMNTRIQVEHPVTEMTTGIDLVAEQIRIAAGKPLCFSQEDVVQRGHAIECRIYAESPENNFLPSPGDISFFQPPEGNQHRLDTYISRPVRIQSSYDPMVAKLICYGRDREQARKESILALKHFAIHGIDTNISFLIHLLSHEDFVHNRISTNYCDQKITKLLETMQSERDKAPRLPVIAAGLIHGLNADQAVTPSQQNLWQEIGYWRLYPSLNISLDDEDHTVELWSKGAGEYELQWQGRTVIFRIEHKNKGKFVYHIDDHRFTAFVSANEDLSLQISLDGKQFHFRRYDRLTGSELILDENHQDGADQLKSPMPGKVILLNVQEGDPVKKGDVLLVVEAMKMENNIIASRDATVEKVYVAQDSMVDRNMPLVKLAD